IPGDVININFEYNAKVYDRESMERVRGHLLQILHQVVADADIRVEQMELLTEGEKRQLLQTLNDTAAPYPQTTVYQWFEAQS
ncbi:condensation domain-containing protein, partial [Bacillus vallismortis]|nr:condensation domain-containing protein [Bacillus vallismortis]